MTTSTYTLTLCDVFGKLIAVVPEAPVLPRYLHIAGDTAQFSDNDTPLDLDEAVTFARIASSVWSEDERGALFVQVA